MGCFVFLFLIFATAAVALKHEEDLSSEPPGSLFSRSIQVKATGQNHKCRGISVLTGFVVGEIGEGCPKETPVCVTQSIGEYFSGKASFQAKEGNKCIVCMKVPGKVFNLAVSSVTLGCPALKACKNKNGQQVGENEIGTKCEQ